MGSYYYKKSYKNIYGPGNWQMREDSEQFSTDDNGQRAATEWVQSKQATLDGDYVKFISSNIYPSGRSAKRNLHLQDFDVDWADTALDIVVKCLEDCFPYFDSVPGVEQDWEDLWSRVQVHLAAFEVYSNNEASDIRYVEIFKGQADLVRLKAGVNPRKSTSGGGVGNPCWQEDSQDPFWWHVNGHEYLPATTNMVYHSAKKDSSGNVFSSMEFAFVIKVECVNALMVGDSITLQLGEVQGRGSYELQDKFIIPVISAQPRGLVGGIDGNDTLTWSVRGGVSGALPEYLLRKREGNSYRAAGVSFDITLSGVPYCLGDQFSFGVERGRFQYQLDRQQWSSSADIQDEAISLGDGIEVLFKKGIFPSFVHHDRFKFFVEQVHSFDNAFIADRECWRWDFTTVQMEANFGAVKLLASLVLALHTIQATAKITLEGSVDGFATISWSQNITWVRDLIVTVLDDLQASSIRLIIENSPGSEIGWVYLGPSITTKYDAEISLRTTYRLGGGGKLNGKLYQARGRAGSIKWDKFLNDVDLQSILNIVEHVKVNNDEFLVLVPHFMHPQDSILCRIASEDLQITDVHNYQSDNREHRMLSLSLPLATVFY